MKRLDIPRYVVATRADCPDCYLVQRGPDAPVLVVVHGISRNGAEMAARFAESPHFAGWTIVAPLFEKQRFGQYQQMLAQGGQVRSDRAMLNLLDALAKDFGCNTDAPAWFGFSGGAQFCHRFAMLYPQRVAAAYCVSAGWYAMPNEMLPWPFGMGCGRPADYNPAAAMAVPITIAVGEHDMRIDGSVRQAPMINSIQGDTRIRRAKRWTKAMQSIAIELRAPSCVTLELLAGGVHDFAICVRQTSMMASAAKAFADISTVNLAYRAASGE
jgi:pimeloyl-ACP methyl ester carboxylesterase